MGRDSRPAGRRQFSDPLRFVAANLDFPRMLRAPNNARLVSALLAWFGAHARDLPWRRTRDPYAIWVSEIMLQQTQVRTVIPYWQRWMRELPTIGSLAKAKPDKIHKLWEGLGYYTRVRNLQKAAQQIVAEHGGAFPRDFHAILALPGIGRYTAGAICSIAFNQAKPILDGNVIRVLTRVFGIAGNPRGRKINNRLWQLAEELVTHASERWGERPREPVSEPSDEKKPVRGDTRPTNACSHLNQSLMELGALVCTPRNPQCDRCPTRQLCVAFREQRVDKLPSLGRRAAATERRFIAFIVERDGKYLVCRRPAGVVNAHLWEFPNGEISGDINSPVAAARDLRLAPRRLPPLVTVRHAITRYRITLTAFRATLAQPAAPIPGRWLTLSRLEKLAFTSAHRKILARLAEAG